MNKIEIAVQRGIENVKRESPTMVRQFAKSAVFGAVLFSLLVTYSYWSKWF